MFQKSRELRKSALSVEDDKGESNKIEINNDYEDLYDRLHDDNVFNFDELWK